MIECKGSRYAVCCAIRCYASKFWSHDPTHRGIRRKIESFLRSTYSAITISFQNMLSVFSQLVIFILTAGVSLTLAQQMLGVQQLGASCSNCGAMQVQISNLLTETCTIQTFWRLRKDPDIASSNKETLQASLLKSCRAIIFGPLFTSRNFTTEELLAVSFSNNYDYRKAFAQLSSYLCFRVCAFSVASVRRCYEFQTETSAEHAEADDPSYTFLLKIVQTNAADQAFDFQVLPEVSDSSSNASQPFAIQEDQFCKTGIPAQT